MKTKLALLKYAGVLAAVFVVALLLAWGPPGAQLDRWAYDAILVALPPTPGPSASVIVAIDEESLDELGGLGNLRGPLARALAVIERNEPSAIALDIVLAEPRTSEENEPLTQVFEAIGNEVLAANLRAANQAGATSWEMPLAAFSEHAAALGHVHAEPDSDGVCRRIVLAKAAGRTRLWAMALEAYRLSIGAPEIVETADGLEFGGHKTPAATRYGRELLIRYRGPDAPIERISLKAILDDPSVAETVRNRAVFVGVDVLGGIDRYLMTPYSFGTPMSGVTINANVFETLHSGRFLTRVSDSWALLLSLVVAAGLGATFWILAGRAMMVTASGLLLAAILAPAAVFAADQVLSFATIAVPSWSVFAVGAGYHHLVIRRKLTHAEAERSRYQRAVHYVTHEMRTPLTTIQGSSELITKYQLTDEKRQELGGLIHTESQRLARMVEMFLGVERLNSGDLKLQRQQVLPSKILREAVERVKPVAKRKPIDLKIGECDTPAIAADAEFLEYACYNLITNAVKYSPAHTQVSVRARDDRDHVLIEVNDQGYGMDENDLQRIFHRFYRTKSAERSGENGSGLGLALVEEIVLQHGGSIEVESQVDHGSCFRMRLPKTASAGLKEEPTAEGST